MSPTLIWPFIILQVATVVAIVLFLRMLLHRQLEIGMRRIKNLDQENLKKEVKLNAELEKLNKEYDAKIEDARRQADILVNTAKEDAKKMRDSEREKAKEEAKRIIASALQEKEKALKEAGKTVYARAVDFAVMILKRVFSEGELSGLRGAVTKEVIAGLFESDSVRELVEKSKGAAEVVTADKLTAKDEEYILKTIEKEAKEKAKVKFIVDKDVLGGLVLKIGKSVIDAGLVCRINKAAAEIKDEI